MEEDGPRARQHGQDPARPAAKARSDLRRGTGTLRHARAPRKGSHAMTTLSLFPGFERRRIKTSGAMINLVIGGDGPPLLLLHGNPQTHVMWHKVAPSLAREFTVVCADLRGYGESSKPRGLPGHANYSKRAMALDMAEAMERLGYLGFHVVGHDRGGPSAPPLARDFCRRLGSFTGLDISPPLKKY